MEGEIYMRYVRNPFVGSALVTLIAGLALLAFPLHSLAAVVRLLGFAVLLCGAAGLIACFTAVVVFFPGARLAYAAAVTITGVVMISNPALVIGIFPTIAGIAIVIQGVDNLLTALSIRSAGGMGWGTMLALSALAVLGGLFICSNPFAVQSTLLRVTGAVLAYNGAVRLFGASRI